MRSELVAIYGVPALAGAVTAAVLLGPGRERPVEGVRLEALIAEGARHTNLDVIALRHEDGAYHPAELEGLVLELRQSEIVGRWSGATPGGHAEANLPLAEPARDRLTLRLADASGAMLGEAGIEVVPRLDIETALPSWVEGEPELSVWLPRGFAVPEMPEELVVRASTGATEATIVVEADGARVQTPPPQTSCEEVCLHTWRLRVTPTATSTQLTVAVTAEGATNRWQGGIPLAPGRIWLDPEAKPWRLQAPHPVEVAYLTLLSAEGRIWGAEVPMTLDDRGFASGAVPPPSFHPRGQGPFALAVTSDPHDDGGAIWPLRPHEAARLRPRPAALVLDTLPAAVAAEEARSQAARLPAFGLILAAGLFELVFLVHRARRSSRDLRQHLERGELPPATARRLETRSPLWWLSILTLGLVLAFVVLAGLVLFAWR